MTTEFKNKLDEFITRATPEELDRCARAAKTSITYLTHLARQYGAGRCPNVRLALGVERATRAIRAENNRRTPVVTVEDIGAICGWEDAKACA